MNSKCHACGHEFAQKLLKCPKCGMAQSQLQSEPAAEQVTYQAPIPVPERSVSQAPQEKLKAEVDYLSKKLKLISDESSRLNQDIQKMARKKEAFGEELTHVVTSRMRGRFALWKGFLLWSLIMAAGIVYLTVHQYLGSDDYINKKLDIKFSQNSSQMIDDVLQAASKAMLEKDARPELEKLKKEISDYRDFIAQSKSAMRTENDLFAEQMAMNQEKLREMEKALTKQKKEPLEKELPPLPLVTNKVQNPEPNLLPDAKETDAASTEEVVIPKEDTIEAPPIQTL